MQKYLLLMLLCCLTFVQAADADAAVAQAGQSPRLQVQAVSDAPLAAGKPAHVTLTITQASTGKPITLAHMKTVHTQKLHVLMIDPSLTDYHHIHPLAGAHAGEYVFDFTPQSAGDYRIFADITLTDGYHEYAPAALGTVVPDIVADTTPHIVSQVGEYKATLRFDSSTLSAGEAAMGSIAITKNGKPFTQLEPVMGAFAHIVGFPADRSSVVHMHPMGEEPTRADQRGGPNLEFHMEPPKPGFIKLFAQIRVDGKDIFLPFGVSVGK